MQSQSSSAWAHWGGVLPRARYGGEQGQTTLRHSSRTHHGTSTCVAGKRHLKTSHQSLALSLLHPPACISSTVVARPFVPQMWSVCSASVFSYWQYGSVFQPLPSNVIWRLLGLKLNSKSKQRSIEHAIGHENFTGKQSFFYEGSLNIHSNVKGKFPLITKNITTQIKCVSRELYLMFSYFSFSPFASDDAESQKFLTNGYLAKKKLEDYNEEYVSFVNFKLMNNYKVDLIDLIFF